MTEEIPEFRDLMQDVLAGSPDAARDLTRFYGPLILRAIRRHLHPRLRSQFDSQDFVQDVWASFFANLPQQDRFTEPENLAKFLALLARNKVVDVVRQRVEGKGDNVLRQYSLGDPSLTESTEIPARQATPSTVAMSHEEWDQLLQRQPPVYRHILLRVREGRTPLEIARETGVSDRTVRRVLHKTLPGLYP